MVYDFGFPIIKRQNSKYTEGSFLRHSCKISVTKPRDSRFKVRCNRKTACYAVTPRFKSLFGFAYYQDLAATPPLKRQSARPTSKPPFLRQTQMPIIVPNVAPRRIGRVFTSINPPFYVEFVSQNPRFHERTTIQPNAVV